MKKLLLWTVPLVLSAAVALAGPKPCQELKDEIAKKLGAHGAKSYTLEIVAKDKQAEGQVVGTCDGGTQKILYSKEAAPAKTPEKTPAKK